MDMTNVSRHIQKPLLNKSYNKGEKIIASCGWWSVTYVTLDCCICCCCCCWCCLLLCLASSCLASSSCICRSDATGLPLQQIENHQKPAKTIKFLQWNFVFGLPVFLHFIVFVFCNSSEFIWLMFFLSFFLSCILFVSILTTLLYSVECHLYIHIEKSKQWWLRVWRIASPEQHYMAQTEKNVDG